MAENSNIEWTDHTVNLWWGCSKVHTGCKNCYAETWSNRKMHDDEVLWGEDSPRRYIKSSFNNLRKYQSRAEKSGVNQIVFCGSMMDIFEDSKELLNPIQSETSKTPVTNTDQLRRLLFQMIEVGLFNNLVFLFLTKRPENINSMVPPAWLKDCPSNVWFGTSVSDQETANKYVPRLLKVNGKKFLSVEPQKDHINLTNIDAETGGDPDWCFINCLNGRHSDMGRPCEDVPKIDWIIQGGESGPKRRPFEIAWAESMRDQCAAVNIPYFFKQIDKVQPIPENLQVRQLPKF